MASTIVISDFVTGYETDVAPAKLSNDAFQKLENALIWRNRLKQKDGVQFIGRLQREITKSLGNTDGLGNLSVNILTIAPAVELSASIRASSIAINVGGIETFIDNGSGILIGSLAGTGTINYANGNLTISGSAIAQPVSIIFTYFPGLPTMALANFNTPQLNIEELIGFDTKYAYRFSSTQFVDATFYKMASPRTPFTFSGADWQQFDNFNYRQSMWVTNNVPGNFALTVSVTNYVSATGIITTSANHGLTNGMVVTFAQVVGACADAMNGNPFVISAAAGNNFTISSGLGAYTSGGVIIVVAGSLANSGDGIKWYDGNSSGKGFVNFQPPLSGSGTNTIYLRGALTGCVFKDRVLFFNTYEDTASSTVPQQFNQRVRYSQNGTPYFGYSPTGQVTSALAWDETTPGRGGYIDAPTDEWITGIAQNKDVVLVFFERSTWRLVYTGNEVLPFIWQKINDQLGVESTFSTVQFDSYAMGFGQTGVHEATVNDIKRVDSKIPYTIFEIRNSDFGPQRVSGIINYYDEVVYFAYPQSGSGEDPSFVFNNRILVYNYVNKSFATFYDTITALGYFYVPAALNGLTWNQSNFTWSQAMIPWGDSQNYTGYRSTIGGNQQGYVFAFKQGKSSNDVQLYITDVDTNLLTLTVLNHGLINGDYIQVKNCLGITGIEGENYQVEVIGNDTIRLATTNSTNLNWTGTYLGKGEICKIIVPNVVTKEFNAFMQVPISIRMTEADFYVKQTSSGSFVCNVYDNSSLNIPVNSFSETNLGSITTINNINYSDSNIVTTTQNQLLIGNTNQEYNWTMLQCSAQGQSLRLQMTYDVRQFSDYNKSLGLYFEVQAIVIFTQSSGRLIQ